jgi:hypothetical protein
VTQEIPESDDMIDIFYLIDVRETPTREKTTTIARKIGEDFLATYLRKDSMHYSGYTVAHGQFTPFWRLATVPKAMIPNLHQLNQHGYIGKVERRFDSY